MTKHTDILRRHLLEMEPPDPKCQERFNKEIHAVFEQELTRRSRIIWTLSLLAALLFAAWGSLVIFYGQVDVFIRLVWVVYTLANVAFAAYCLYVLKKGVLNLRYLFTFLVMAPAGALVISVLLIARAASEPSLESLLWAGFGVMCLIVALAWSIHNRITNVELTSREQFLRLESRLLDLADRLPPSGSQ